MPTKRPRGRPAGSGIDDSRFLQEVAGHLIADTRIKPTTAMRRAMKAHGGNIHSEAAMLRRLQAKWKVHKAEFMAEAHRRQQVANSPGATIADFIELGIVLRGVYERVVTPQNVENALRVAHAVNQRFQQLMEPLARLQQHPMFNHENVQKLTESVERMKAMDRYARHVIR